MCGIVGYYRPINGFFDNDVLNIARNLLIHRGPDDTGLFEDEKFGVGLAHTRLSILDTSLLGHQPMISEDQSVVLVFNGEIYNFRDLREELVLEGYSFKGNSDTEVLLKLYQRYRSINGDMTEMLRRLNGMFAIALWDRGLEELFLARDAFGIKPLYYSLCDNYFSFASEVKALLPFLPKNLHLGSGSIDDIYAPAIDHYLSFLWCPGERTAFKNINIVPPGEIFRVKKNLEIERINWYKLPLSRRDSKNNQESKNSNVSTRFDKNNAVVNTRKYLQEAVNRQMVSDVPVGAFLSGGLDSSSIVTFAREINPDIHCFTIEVNDAHDSGVVDDLPYARLVAKHLNVKLDVVQVDAKRVIDDLPQMIAQLDEPLADPAALNVRYICNLARNQGVKVLLSGAGGDDLFTGYRRHYAINLERYWDWLPKPVLGHLDLLAKIPDQNNFVGRRLRKILSGASLSKDARIVNYFRWIRRDDLEQLYTREFKRILEQNPTQNPLLNFLSDLPTDINPLERMLALEQRFFLTDHNLNYTDKMSMVEGVEVRVPFLDLDLVEFAAQIPISLKQKGSEGKWVLKKAMEPYLPKKIIYRSKTGFGVPMRRWIRIELRELMMELLGDVSLRNRGFFEPKAVQQLIKANDSGGIDASYTLFSLICIEIWCRKYVD